MCVALMKISLVEYRTFNDYINSYLLQCVSVKNKGLLSEVKNGFPEEVSLRVQPKGSVNANQMERGECREAQKRF